MLGVLFEIVVHISQTKTQACAEGMVSSVTQTGASANVLIRGLSASHKLLIFNHHRRPAC